MIVPSRADFRTLTRSGKLVPVYREVFADHDTPVSAFRKIDDGSFGFLLESVEGGEKWGRYSLLGSRPSLVFTARGDRCEILRRGAVTACARPPIEELTELLRAHQAVALPGLPRFCGGAVGFFGYDAVRWFERLPARAKDDLGVPDAVFVFGDVVSVFDNLTHTLKVVTHARGDGDPDGAYSAAVARLDAEVARLRAPLAWIDTRPRGRTPDEDHLLEDELLASEKERAEHVMLVDLGRNDVGRVAEYGSVETNEYMSVERYSQVMHLVSNVRGRARRDLKPLDIVRACFPAGTVSGAPKVRAMEIIAALEPVRRGVYAGAVGHFDYHGNLDLCIAIRTLVHADGRAHWGVGAGIVADSEAEREWEETMNKAKALWLAVQRAERGPE